MLHFLVLRDLEKVSAIDVLCALNKGWDTYGGLFKERDLRWTVLYNGVNDCWDRKADDRLNIEDNILHAVLRRAGLML